MTRRDYVLLAKTIAAASDRIRRDLPLTSIEMNNQLRGVRRAAAHLADALRENPQFDPVIFLKACGYGAGLVFKGDTYTSSEERPE